MDRLHRTQGQEAENTLHFKSIHKNKFVKKQ